jgi:phthalate 4,5-cis-dihydrodiol dehydrogenase
MSENRKLRLGIAGLGRAFSVMLPTFTRDSRVTLAAAADPRPEARRCFEADFGAPTFETVEALCADADIDAVYVATPHQHHADHACMAARHGRHILVEKPIALTLDDAARMIEAARRAQVHLVVGHSHSFDAPILRTRALIETGAFGRVRMISALEYTDFLYRLRRPEELDTSKGGGALFNQAPHQVDIVRVLGGGRVQSVRAMTGTWDAVRPTEGAYAALLGFTDGTFASLVYGGYGHFDSDEFQGWIGEMGQKKTPQSLARPPRFSDPAQEAAAKDARNYGGERWQPPATEALLHQHFGTFIVSCEDAELRPMPDGVMIYQNGTTRRDALAPPDVPRREVVDELFAAVMLDRPPSHDGAWAMATLEVCLAMLRSSREGTEVTLEHQVEWP